MCCRRGAQVAVDPARFRLACCVSVAARELVRDSDGLTILQSGTLERYTHAMLQAFLPQSATRVVVYLEPINIRWGAKKLGVICREVVGIEPDQRTCFLFVNARRDTLLVYFLDAEGEETILKKLLEGAFPLPPPEPDTAPFVIFRRSELARLFRA